MEGLIVLLWFLLMIGVPVMLLVSAFIRYRRNSDLFAAFSLIILGLIIHIAIFALTLTLMFVLVFAGAHTEPPGNALSTLARIVWLSVEVLYAFLWVSGSSLIAGRARPWPLRVPELT